MENSMLRSGTGLRNATGLVAGIALLGTTAIPAARAAPPSELADLVGARGSSGESELQDRGYEYVSTKEGSDRKWSYWWHKSDKHCVVVTTYNGRYDAIDKASNKDCGKSGDGGKTAAVAIGAAAVIGAIALAASGKKDKHKDRYPPGASDSPPYALRDLEGIRASSGESALTNRGYRFKSWGSGSYSRWAYWWSRRNDQCIAVMTDDGRYEDIVSVPSSYCGKGGPGYSGGGGYGSSAAFEDLNGARASSADSELRQRGFANVDGFKSGNTAYTIWSRRQSHQCLQMTVADGRVEDIRDIHTHPKCR
jgi:hypothetical protein